MIETYVLTISQVELSMLQNAIESYKHSEDYTDLSEVLVNALSHKLNVGDMTISNNEHMFIMDCLDAYKSDESMREARLGMNISIPRFEARMDEAMMEQMIKPDYPGLYRRYWENHPEYQKKHPYVYDESKNADADESESETENDFKKSENEL